MPIKGVKNHIAKTQILPPHPHVIFFCQKTIEVLGRQRNQMNRMIWLFFERYFVYTQKQI